MVHHVVKLRFVGAQIQTDPYPVVVAPGDTVVWTSDGGDVSVSFVDSPFVTAGPFAGLKGQYTTVAEVRLNAPRGKSFSCAASIGGKSGSGVYGVEIEP